MNNILKYIEILSIEQVDDKYYLQVALHANSVTEVYWQIDEVTYENLYLQCDFTGSDRYRLSFKILENPLINKLVGRITRTYLTSSSMIDFQTTKEFKEQVRLIKLHSQMNTLYQLSFIEQKIHTLYADEPEVAVIAATDAISTPIDDSDAELVPIDDAPAMELELVEEEIVAVEGEVDQPAEIDASAEQPNHSAIEADISNSTEPEELDVPVNEEPLETPASDDLEEQEAQQSLTAPTSTEELEEPQTTKDLSYTHSENQAAMLKTLVEERALEQLDAVESQIEANSEPIQLPPMQVEPFNLPIQTIMTLPTIKQHTPIVHSVEEDEVTLKEEVATTEVNELALKEHTSANEISDEASKDETTVLESNEVESKDDIAAIEVNEADSKDEVTATKSNEVDSKDEAVVIDVNSKDQEVDAETIIPIEKVDITTEEVAAEAQTLAADPAELSEPSPEQSATQAQLVKQPIVENEVEEPQHLSNNMIALIAVAVAIFIAVAIYLAFFQQNAKTLNTETAIASETANTVTYNIEESFTFSLPSEYVALTFNRGPSPYTEEILSILKEYNYGATFFLQGNQVPLYPDLVKTIDANGHSIGHITNSHTLLTILETEEQREALVKPKEQIEQLINKETLLVRPPFNTFNQNTISIQQEYNFKIVNSSIALKSGNDVQADTIIQEFLNIKELEGAIIGLDESQATVEALPTILEKIKQSDLQVVLLK